VSPTGWLAPASLIALGLTAIFAAVALLRPSRAVLTYAVLGAAPPVLQLGALSGRTISQGLLLAEALATVLVGVWLARRSAAVRLLKTPFDGPLLLFAASAAASLVLSLVMPDPNVARELTLAVSVGQLMLVLWPIGVYLASSELITTGAQIRWLQKAVLVLAIAQLAMPFVPKAGVPYMAWVWTFGLYASPFAMAAIFATRSVPIRLGLMVLALAPMVRGVVEGKVFLYAFVFAAMGTILWVRASRVVAVGLGLVAAVSLTALVVLGPETVLAPVSSLVNLERRQQSFGARGGRVELARAAIGIWQQAPILGVGPGNSYIYMLRLAPIGTPHNQYLNILVEFGMVGLVLWIWFLVSAFRTGLRIYQRTTDLVCRTFALGWLGTFAGMVVGGGTGDYMIHSIRNGGLELFQGYYLQWILLGGLIAIARLEQAARAPSSAAPAARQTVYQRPPLLGRRLAPAARH
jgi:O-antigen ligase